MNRNLRKGLHRGFTLIELLVVIALIGVVASIGAPLWMRFLAGQKVTSARGLIRQNIQQAQLNAQKNNVLWQFSIRDSNGHVETSTHPATTVPSSSNWEPLHPSILLDRETTLLSSGGVYYVRFDHNGNVRSSRLGRVTVSIKDFQEIKRCVIVSTLIGATRVAEERSVADPSYDTRDRFCY